MIIVKSLSLCAFNYTTNYQLNKVNMFFFFFGIHYENLLFPKFPSRHLLTYIKYRLLCNDRYFIYRGSPTLKSFKIPERGGLRAHLLFLPHLEITCFWPRPSLSGKDRWALRWIVFSHNVKYLSLSQTWIQNRSLLWAKISQIRLTDRSFFRVCCAWCTFEPPTSSKRSDGAARNEQWSAHTHTYEEYMSHISHLSVSAGDHVNTSECIFVEKSIHLRKTRAHPVERRAVHTRKLLRFVTVIYLCCYAITVRCCRGLISDLNEAAQGL